MLNSKTCLQLRYKNIIFTCFRLKKYELHKHQNINIYDEHLIRKYINWNLSISITTEYIRITFFYHIVYVLYVSYKKIKRLFTVI